MKITEVINLEKFNADEYDIKEDLIFFMNNDPIFYRKMYYPSLLKFRDAYKKDNNFDCEEFAPMVSQAYKMYQKKFPVQNLKSSLDKTMLDEICSKVYEQELENIKMGHYNDRK